MTPYSPLEQERRNRGWSRAYVEEHFGIPHDTLSDAEKGKHKPRQALCETFCTIYSKTPEQLGLDKSSGIMVVEKKVVVTKHQGNNCIIVGVPEGNPMSDFLKSSFLTDLSSRLSSILNAWPRRNLYYEDL